MSDKTIKEMKAAVLKLHPKAYAQIHPWDDRLGWDFTINTDHQDPDSDISGSFVDEYAAWADAYAKLPASQPQDAPERDDSPLCVQHGFSDCSICPHPIAMIENDGFREWLDANTQGMEGEDDTETLMHVAWKASLMKTHAEVIDMLRDQILEDAAKMEEPYWECVCGVRAYPLTDDTKCKCSDIYEQEWNRHPPIEENKNPASQAQDAVEEPLPLLDNQAHGDLLIFTGTMQAERSVRVCRERQLREALARNVELLESGRVSNNSLTSRILEVINENGLLRAENKRLVEKVEKWAGIS